MAAIPGWMAVCAAAGAVGGAAYRAISPSKRLRGPSEGESAPPPHSVPDECDDGAEEVAGGEKSADGRGRKGEKRGKVSDRWITRCTKEAITGDLATGCGCPSGCTDHMSVDLVMTERKEVADLDGDERRTDLRRYLDGNVNKDTTLGFNSILYLTLIVDYARMPLISCEGMGTATHTSSYELPAMELGRTVWALRAGLIDTRKIRSNRS